MPTVAIGIQARLASTRLKEKAIYRLTDKAVIMHLLDRVYNSVNWVTNKPERHNISIDVCLLAPKYESEFWTDFVHHYSRANGVDLRLILGDMDDVFSRYLKMSELFKPNYIMRLTGDCPIIPSPLISKAMNIAMKHRLDYISNVDPLYRTMPDGYDVEVISSDAFSFLAENVYDSIDADLEHVTTYLRKNFQKWMRVGVISTNLDQSELKYSIDRKHDFDNVESLFESKIRKDNLALKRGFGVYEY